MIKAERLRTEFLENPEAVAKVHPSLGWSIESDGADGSAYMSAHRIIAAENKENCEPGKADLWDSGWTESTAPTAHRYGGKLPDYGKKCYWRVCLRDSEGYEGKWSEAAYFRRAPESFDADFIRTEPKIDIENGELCPPVAFGRKIKIDGNVTEALLYVTALGIYRIYIDGEEYEETILAPEWTDYNKRCQYKVINLTDRLEPGEHEIIISLSNGWYSGVWQHWPPRPYGYGKYPELCAFLALERNDGERTTIPTDGTWRATHHLPTTFAGIYEGERIDGRIGFPRVDNLCDEVTVRKEKPCLLVPQCNEPISLLEEIPAVSITSPSPGVFVADFGVNIAGSISMTVNAPRDTHIELFHNEMLNHDGTVYRDNLVAGHFLPPDTMRQTVTYECSGNGDELIRPGFTYMGFRYVEIRGLPDADSIKEINARVFGSKIRQTGTFSCSDKDINTLQGNIIRSAHANFMGVPTDCPQRDERCGYTGDMQFFMPTALDNFNMAAFMRKWLTDLCEDSQLEDGSFTDHAPRIDRYGHNLGWEDAGIICPYLTCREYGDTDLIEEHFDAMERFMDYCIRNTNEMYVRTDRCCGNGDWLHTGPGISNELLTISYLGMEVGMMEEMCRASGRTERAEYYRKLLGKIKKSYAENFILPDGSLKDAGVTGYTLAFTIDLLPENEEIRRRAAEAFARVISENGDCITTGFIGTPRLLPSLHNIGRDDLAERLLMNRRCPSWLYPVTVGATTIWERYNGWTAENGFADSGMNSFNHFAFGSVGDYFYKAILGIGSAEDADDTTPEEYRTHKIVPVSPVFLTSLDSAKGHREIAGSFVDVSWHRDGETVTADITAGPNITVRADVWGQRVYVPAGETVSLRAVC